MEEKLKQSINQEEKEDARLGYQVATDLWAYEGQLLWSKFNAMLVANSIVLATIGLGISASSKLAIFTKGMPIADDVDLTNLAKKTEMFSGADIESLCREAAILALRKDIHADTIYKSQFDDAFAEIRASISKEMLDWYENFEVTLKIKQTGRSGKRGGFYT